MKTHKSIFFSKKVLKSGIAKNNICRWRAFRLATLVLNLSALSKNANHNLDGQLLCLNYQQLQRNSDSSQQDMRGVNTEINKTVWPGIYISDSYPYTFPYIFNINARKL